MQSPAGAKGLAIDVEPKSDFNRAAGIDHQQILGVIGNGILANGTSRAARNEPNNNELPNEPKMIVIDQTELAQKSAPISWRKKSHPKLKNSRLGKNILMGDQNLVDERASRP